MYFNQSDIIKLYHIIYFYATFYNSFYFFNIINFTMIKRKIIILYTLLSIKSNYNKYLPFLFILLFLLIKLIII